MSNFFEGDSKCGARGSGRSRACSRARGMGVVKGLLALPLLFAIGAAIAYGVSALAAALTP
jgi:hypothetical protein